MFIKTFYDNSANIYNIFDGNVLRDCEVNGKNTQKRRTNFFDR